MAESVSLQQKQSQRVLELVAVKSLGFRAVTSEASRDPSATADRAAKRLT